jgi:hypothetical protein
MRRSTQRAGTREKGEGGARREGRLPVWAGFVGRAGGLLFGLAAGSAHAQIPVTDFANLVQTGLTAARSEQQIQKLAEQYQKQIEQLQVAIEERDALRGTRALGQLLNGPDAQAERRGVPARFEELLRLASQVDATRRRPPRSFAELVRGLEQITGGIELAQAADVAPSRPEGSAARAHQRQRDTALAQAALAQKAYDDAAQRIATYETFLQQIDRSDDLKASVDLSNRIAAENGLLMLELIRLSAAGASARSAEQVVELVGTTEQARMLRFESVPIDRLPELAREVARAAERSEAKEVP